MSEKIIKYLKENISIIAIILFFINFLGYLYMVSQLEYFNIDKAFYQLNIFNDFYAFFIIAILFAIPVAIAIIPTL